MEINNRMNTQKKLIDNPLLKVYNFLLYLYTNIGASSQRSHNPEYFRISFPYAFSTWPVSGNGLLIVSFMVPDLLSSNNAAFICYMTLYPGVVNYAELARKEEIPPGSLILVALLTGHGSTAICQHRFLLTADARHADPKSHGVGVVQRGPGQGRHGYAIVQRHTHAQVYL